MIFRPYKKIAQFVIDLSINHENSSRDFKNRNSLFSELWSAVMHQTSSHEKLQRFFDMRSFLSSLDLLNPIF